MKTILKKTFNGIELIVITLFALGFIYCLFESINRQHEYDNAGWYLVSINSIESSDVLKIESIMYLGNDHVNCDLFVDEFKKLAKKGSTYRCISGMDVKPYPQEWHNLLLRS